MGSQKELEKLVEEKMIDAREIAREIALKIRTSCDRGERISDKFEHFKIMQRLGLLSEFNYYCYNNINLYALTQKALKLYEQLKKEGFYSKPTEH